MSMITIPHVDLSITDKTRTSRTERNDVPGILNDPKVFPVFRFAEYSRPYDLSKDSRDILRPGPPVIATGVIISDPPGKPNMHTPTIT